jgi:hypothetical protein
MGRTNYSLNEMLNSVTKRAFNRYTPQTVDYQHLEAATTTTGLVSNRREYSSASILANVFSLNAKNIVESNYEPFLKTFVSNLISRKTFPVIGSHTFTCTDDRRFLAVTSKFSNTDPNEVRVYEFDENLVEQFELNSSGVIDTSGNTETFDVDINSDGSETFVAKKVGTQVVVDNFDQGFNLVSSTTLLTTYSTPVNGLISVSESGSRVAVSATINHWLFSRVLGLQVHDNLKTNEYYSLYDLNADINIVRSASTYFALMSRNGRIVVVCRDNPGFVSTFEIPVASPSGVVSLSPVRTQTMGIDKFDLSYDGKVMLTHSSSDALIYIWNGLEWKQFGQNIPTGLTQVYSSAISYYADYFVVVSSTAMKIFKLDKTSKIFEQYGNTITGDFGTTGQTVRINNLGDTVVTGNSQINSSSGQSFTYMYDGERWGIIEEVSGSTAGDNLGKFLKLSNNSDKLFLGSTDEILVKSATITNKSSGWKQRGSVITTTKVNDDFGSSLSLSNDGTYLVIGIPREQGTSLDDTMGGSVKVYRFAQGDWSQYGGEILGDGPVDFGKYVSISLDGSKVAVGSDKNAYVKVYDTTNTTNVYNSTITDTVSVTPLTSLLEMSGDGNRLFINTDPVVSSTILQSLTVVSTPSGNKYSLDGVTQPTLYLKKGVTFTGIQDSLRQDGTHPLKISATPDGTHGGDTTVVAEVDLIGSLTIPNSAPDTLYYFCGQHPNMGGVVKIMQGLSVWDKNDAGVWGYRDGLTEGSAVDLSNNGSYLGVEYNNTGRLYGIDSDGLVSKIGEDITLTTVSSLVNVFRTFTPTHINTNATDSGSLILASYRDATRDVEICSLTWDPTLTGNFSISTQSSELTGFSSLSQAKYGIVLSRNGQTLIVYDDLKFSVYTYDGTQWTFIRSSVIGVAGTSYTIRYVAISYDGTLMAYHFFNAVDGYLISFRNTISGSLVGFSLGFTVQVSTFTFKSNTTLAVCIPNQDIQLYNYVNNSWILSNEITPGYSSPFTEAHAKWSGDGSRLAVGDVNAERVSFYEYDNSLISVTTFSQSGSTISGPTEQVVSGNGNVRVVGHPQYTGYVEIYEKDGNGDWPSTANATFNGSSPTENFGSSIGISETGTRVVIGSGSKMIVVEKSGGTWSQLGSDISGSTTKVAISGDGTKVFNSHGTNLYSYELSSGNWVTYLSTITTDGSIVKVNSSSNGDDIALSKSNSNKVYRKSSITTRLGADIDGEATNDQYGWSVSLSADGSRVAIGARYNDGNGTNSGHVRVYDWSGSSWTKVGADIDGEAANDQSGWSVSLSADGSRVAIGASYNYGNGSYSGHVRVYDWSGSSWTKVGADIDGEAAYDQSGSSVSLSADGSRVAIGAYGNDGNGQSSGHVRVYDWSGSSWTKVGADIDGEAAYDQSGYSVSLSADGSRVAIGAYAHDSYSGHVRVYDWSGSSWIKVGADIDGEVANDYSGWSVSLSADGSRVAIGAHANDGNGQSSGHVRVYDWSGSSWTKVGADIDGEAANDQSGSSVSLSADGSRVAIGARYNDGNGTNSGHVRVYDWSGSSWTKVGADIDGEAAYDQFGSSVSLSADGLRVAIGACFNDGNGNASGHVRVYKNPGGSYSLQSTDSGPMIDISNDGNTTLTVNSGMGYFNIAALSGDATKAVIWNGINLKQYHYTSGSWVMTYELDIDYIPTSLSINTDGSIVGVASSSDVRFYVFGPGQTPIGWTLHSFIAGGGNTLENFGSIVDISNDGNTVVVGAPGDGTSSYKGYVKVYDYVSGAWTLRHTITASGTSDRNLGKSVSLSSDGNRVGYVFDQETQVTIPGTEESIVINSDPSSGISTNNGGSWSNNSGFAYSSLRIRLTSYAYGGTNSGIWFPVTFGSQWSITFEWSLDNDSFYGDADDMRVVFYARNQPSSYAGSQHGGYNVFHGFYGNETQRIRTPTDADFVSRSVSYGSSTSYKTVTVSYNNGVLFTRVTGTSSSVLYNGSYYTFPGNHLAAQQALWGTQTYVAITGRTGGAAATQYIQNINISWNTPETTTTTTYSQASIRDNVDGTLVNLVQSGETVNLSEERELSAMSMSYDGTQYGIRATSGSYDAVVKIRQPILNGWTLSGSIIQFTAPNSIASNSLRALVSSSDGNVIAFGMNTIIKVYGFSNGVWSQLGSDIVPSVSNPNEISIDLSSDGTTLAVLVDRTTSDPAVCKVFTYSSGSWSQSGSTIDFRPTGINKVRISGNGTTLALGNNTPDSPYPLNVVRVYRKFQDWESIFGTITEGKTPTNFFGASLNLTNDGNNLVTYNTSGVGFYTSSTKAVPSQHLNDITVSGATIVMGDVHLTDSGDRLFVMSGDERVRVYDTTHNQESEFGASINVRDFSVTKDGSSMIVTSDIGLAQVFSRNDTSWSQIGSNITANMSGGGVTTDIKSGGNSIVLLGSSDDLQLHKYENGSWSQIGTSSGTRGTSVVITDTDDIVVGSGSTKTFEIKDEFQDISFTAPTLSLNGDKYVRLESGTSYTEVGATVTTSAAITPGVKISGGVTSDEPRVYTIKYEAEDFQRKQAEPIFRTVEVIPKVSIIKLEGPRVIYHTYDTKLDDPGVTASVPINIYWRKHNSTTVYTGFPNSLSEFDPSTTQITIYYTNDTPDEYLRTASSVERTVYVRRRPALTLRGSSTVYNPLGQRYVDLGVNITQHGVTSPDVTVSFNEPNVNLSQTQTVTYTAKDQFGIEAIPITRQVIVKKRPTITTSGTLYRIRYDPISIPTPLVEPASLSGSLQSYNNIVNNQIGNYSITYNVTDGDGISAITTRQSYQVGSYGKLELSKNGVLSAFSRDGQSLAVFSTDVQLYRLGPDRSWSSNGSIATPVGSSVSSMRFSNDGRYIVIGMSLHLTIGLVRVYKENTLFENNWEQIGIDLFGVDYLGKFGHKVEINDSGSRIFVGAPEANTNGGTLFKAGFVKVYEWNGVFWDEKNIIEGQNPSELLGTSISISKDGNLLAIGSPGFTRTTIVNSVVTSVNVGKTSVYRYVNGTWEDYLGSVIDNGTEGARNAFSLSLSSDGRTLAVGSESNGGVRVYAISALNWRPIGSHISGNFGKTVSISDDATVVIGSENEYYGRAYIYTLTNDWTKSGITFDKVIASGGGTNDFGKRVNVDSSGNFVCVDSATDVRIYEI